MNLNKLVNEVRQPTTCSICKEPISKAKELIDTDYHKIDCDICGNYSIEILLEIKFFHILEINHTLSSWILEQNELYIHPKLIQNEEDKLLSIPDKLISQKYELFLKHVSNTDTMFYKNDKRLQKITWSNNDKELERLINKSIDNKHCYIKKLKKSTIIEDYGITYDGIEFLENLGFQTNSNKIFMAFHFTKNMKEEFETTIKKAVTDASNNKLEAIRVSSSLTEYDMKIDDELISMIKSSKAVIADFTGNRTAVYYEAGFAMGLGIPIIWTCKETDIDKLSFDTRQYPHIIWKDKNDLYTQVSNRLKAKIL